MDYLTRFIKDYERIKEKYPQFEVEYNQQVARIVGELNISNEIKCAVIAIDSSMRLADLVNDDNRAQRILSTDLLSSMFYHYMAKANEPEIFYQLTNAVKCQNIWKQKREREQSHLLNVKIETAFIAPFVDQLEIYYDKIVQNNL